MDSQQTMNLAKEHLQGGRIAAAEPLLRQALAMKPDDAEALYLLGCVAFQMRRPAEAADLLGKAIAVDPNQPAFQSNLGMVLMVMGRRDEAIQALRQAIALSPNHPETNVALGSALCDAGQFDEAIECFNRAVAARPGDGALLFHLGTGLLRKALATPEHGEPRTRALQQSVNCFEQILTRQPDNADAINNLGNALRAMGRTDEAIAVWQRAAASANPLVSLNLGRALCDEDRLDEAMAAMKQSEQLRPDQPELHANLASLYRKIGQAEQAIAHLDRAIALQPDHASPAHSSRLYSMYFHPDYDAERILREHRQWNERFARSLRSPSPHGNDRSPGRRLRIGYVSPNFREHSEAHFIVPLLAGHDHRDFEIHCYSDVKKTDATTGRIRSLADQWHSIAGLSDEQAADFIRRDRIDILVDLTMHMAENRIFVFARKPAPAQVAWLAYPGTTGLETMDYRLTDRYLDPPRESRQLYTEQSAELPDCWVCYDALSDAAPAQPRDNAGPIRFASLNNPCKTNDALLRLWARVLNSVPHSTMLILASGEAHRGRIRGIFQSCGVDPDRIEFIDRTPRERYLRLYDSIDICLDTLPYNGITTTCDALWMGVPVVTLSGRTACGRAGLSILCTIGLPELAAESENDFVEKSTRLAADRPRLSQLRRTLRDRIARSPQMDGGRFARNVEAAYRRMWQTWRQ